MPACVRTTSAPWVIVILRLTVGVCVEACSSSNPDPYQPLSEACDSCLLEAGPEGCGDAYAICEALDECEAVVLCELQQQCYTESSDGSCSRARGCESGADTAELEASAAFEQCARSVCAETCDFVE